MATVNKRKKKPVKVVDPIIIEIEKTIDEIEMEQAKPTGKKKITIRVGDPDRGWIYVDTEE